MVRIGRMWTRIRRIEDVVHSRITSSFGMATLCILLMLGIAFIVHAKANGHNWKQWKHYLKKPQFSVVFGGLIILCALFIFQAGINIRVSMQEPYSRVYVTKMMRNIDFNGRNVLQKRYLKKQLKHSNKDNKPALTTQYDILKAERRRYVKKPSMKFYKPYKNIK